MAKKFGGNANKDTNGKQGYLTGQVEVVAQNVIMNVGVPTKQKKFEKRGKGVQLC